MSPIVEIAESAPGALSEPLCSKNAETLATVAAVRRRHPKSDVAARTVSRAREEFREILAGRDKRLALIVGPCSIHDPDAALEYGRRIRMLRETCGDRFLIIMRVYLEKPRTTIGWKGYINDPGLDGGCDINRGIHLGRKLLCELAEMGVPAATELVEPAITPYIEDLVAWASIGARTVESQSHRQLVSGLGFPAGFKNGTGGDVQVAVDAVTAARHPHVFPAAGPEGAPQLRRTSGNPDAHVVLRGGRSRSGCISNWQKACIVEAGVLLEGKGLPGRLMVDCSHANSGYAPERQAAIARTLVREVAPECSALIGLMLESHLLPGGQKLNGSIDGLAGGLSITDPCLGMDETERLIRELCDCPAVNTVHS